MSAPADDDHALDVRDERIANELRSAIDYKRGLAREYRETAAQLWHEARAIEQAAHTERWYDLEHVLSAEDVESLSHVSPADLLGGGG